MAAQVYCPLTQVPVGLVRTISPSKRISPVPPLEAEGELHHLAGLALRGVLVERRHRHAVGFRRRDQVKVRPLLGVEVAEGDDHVEALRPFFIEYLEKHDD